MQLHPAPSIRPVPSSRQLVSCCHISYCRLAILERQLFCRIVAATLHPRYAHTSYVVARFRTTLSSRLRFDHLRPAQGRDSALAEIRSRTRRNKRQTTSPSGVHGSEYESQTYYLVQKPMPDGVHRVVFHERCRRLIG